METKIQEIIDFKKVDPLLEGFNKTTGFVTAIIDLEGNVLSKSGWRQICTQFHRINHETANNCKISDTELASKMSEGKRIHYYQCLNGLIDVSVPLIINGEHMANLFTGQFFFEKPNIELFEKQAEKYGFDKKIYLESLDKVPVVSKERVQVAMNFLLYVAQLISDIGFQKLEQTKLNEALKKSEKKMRSIYRVAPVGIGVVINRVLKDVNPRICEMTGYRKEELLGKNARILYPSIEEYKFVGSEKYNLIKEKGTGEIETRWQKKDGSIFNVLLASTPIDASNHLKGITFTALDITDRKQAEKALRESEEMMRNSQSVAHISSYSTILNVNDIEKSAWVCSPEFYKIFGIDETYPHTIAGWANFIHPDYRDEMFAYHEAVVREKKSFNHEYKIIRINDGAERWIHGTGELEFDKKGNPVRMHGAIQDITDRKEAEEALRKSEAIKNKMVSNIGDVIVIIDKDGINRYKSSNVEKRFGWKPEEIEGTSIWNIVHHDDVSDARNFIAGLKDEPGKTGTINVRYRCKNGDYKWIEFTGINMLHDDDIQGILGNYSDISDRMKSEQELLKAKERAEESDMLKSSFLANMSHEIRTPMNSIMGFASLLPEEQSKEMMHYYANIIVRNSEQLVHIIDDIVLYSRLQTRLLNNCPIEFKALHLIQDVKQSYALPEYLEKDIELLIENRIEDNCMIVADYEKIRQVLTNLVTNAYKYTKKGSITLGIAQQHKQTLFFVKDTGIGIPKNEFEKVFDRFYRGSNVNHSSISGTGLGLSIVKEMVELLGGKIWVESSSGNQPGDSGSTFYFTIPAHAKD